MQNLITSTYEHQLAYHFHQIDKRGLLIDVEKKKLVEQQCEEELKKNCDWLSNFWNTSVYIGTENKPEDNTKPRMNLNANNGNNTVLINLSRFWPLYYKVTSVQIFFWLN